MLSALSPARRRLVLVVAALAIAALLAGLVAVLHGRSKHGVAVDLYRTGPVLFVPGYGGSRTALLGLAQQVQAETGRTVEVLTLPGDGTGDLDAQAAAIGAAARALLARTGAGSLDLVGYSAGGIAARVWIEQRGGAGLTRRLVTLGTPHHGTELADLGALFGSACPQACQQLRSDSALLDGLNQRSAAAGSVVSIWSSTDDVIVPPTSSVLDGAVDVRIQQVCPGNQVRHSGLPTDPDVRAVVETELGAGPATGAAQLHCAT